MSGLRIALIRQRYNPAGGAERFVSRAMNALTEQGAQISLITRQWESHPDFNPLIVNPFYLGNVWRDWSFARSVCRLLRTHSFDLIQSHERLSCCDIFRAGDGIHRVWLAQRKKSLNAWGRTALWFNPYHHYVLAAEKKLFHSPQLKAVICNSQMVKQEIRHYFNLAEDKLKVIYNGVDTEAYHPNLVQHRQPLRTHYGIPQDATVFLFVGSGFARKGLATLISAFSQLPANCWLLVVGKDKQAKRYFKQSDRLGLSNRVVFAGSQTDVKPFYGAADAFVLPTLYDPFPNVVLEALASGLPVITSTKCGAAEFIQPGMNGFVCDALDSASLANYMQTLLNSTQRSTMAQAARQSVAHLTLAHMAQQLDSLYQSLLANSSC